MKNKIILTIMFICLTMNSAFAAGLGENPPKQPMITGAVSSINKVVQGVATSVDVTVSTQNCAKKEMTLQMLDSAQKPLSGVAIQKKAVPDNGGVTGFKVETAALVKGEYYIQISIESAGLVYSPIKLTVEPPIVTAEQDAATTTGSQNKTVEATGILITPATLTLKINDTSALAVQFSPIDTTDKTVTWKSSNATVADVSTSGVVTAKAVGSAVIFATSKSGSFEAQCAVSVMTNVVNATSVAVSPASVTLKANESAQFSAVVQPQNVTDKTVTWTSSNPTVVSVSSTGRATAVAPGSALVVATCGSIQGSASVTVEQPANTNGTGTTGGTTGGGGGFVPPPFFIPPTTGTLPVTPTVAKPTAQINGIASSSVIATVDEKSKVATFKVDASVMSKMNPIEKVIKIEMPVVTEAKGYALSLPALTFDQKVAPKPVELKTKVADVTLPANMFTGFNLQEKDQVQIQIAPVAVKELPASVQAAIGDRPIIRLTAEVNDKEVSWKQPNAPVQVAVPYKPTAEELKKPEFINVWYIQPSGVVERIPSAKYDSANGRVTFTTTHFSDYSIVYEEKSYSDLGSVSWAETSVKTLASKGVIQFATGNDFLPGKAVTRGEFIDQLIRGLGLKAGGDVTFADVAKSDYYYDSIVTAKVLGITSGTGNNAFKPETTITRQDMMTLMVKAMKVAGYNDLSGQSAVLKSFKDSKQVASYASESVSALVAKGIVKGDGANINPLGNTTRAEAAVLIYKLFKKEV